MNRTAAITLALITLVATVGIGPAAALGAGDAGTTTAVDAQNETNGSDVAPGEQLSAVVGVQEAEIDGDIESRAFGHAVANAANNESKADVVADQVKEDEARLDELEQRKEELKAAREAGNISEGKYRAEMAKIAAETASIQRTANQSANASEDLPAELLEERGVNASAIETLRTRASELNGGEVSEIAKSIAGERTGQPGGAPDDVGERGEAGDRGGADDGEDAENASESIDRAAQEVQTASERLETAERQVGENDTEAQAALEDARTALSNAESALEDARSLAGDDPEAASERAQDALDHARTATEHAEEAMELAGGDGSGDGSTDGDTDGTETGTDTVGTDGDDGA